MTINRRKARKNYEEINIEAGLKFTMEMTKRKSNQIYSI